MRLQSQNEMQLLLSGKTPKHCYVFGHYTGQQHFRYMFLNIKKRYKMWQKYCAILEKVLILRRINNEDAICNYRIKCC